MTAKRTVTATANSQPLVSAPQARVFGPASLSNLGPGFDTLGLCIRGVGDVVEAWLTDTPGVQIVIGKGTVEARVPTDPTRNTAGLAAQEVLKLAVARQGVVLRLRKGIRLGSGIGGSAASAVAAAWATNLLLGQPFAKEMLVPAVLTAEATAASSQHGDNVLPALFGGVVLTSSHPVNYRHISLSRPLAVALIVPHLEILTAPARALLPDTVPFRQAIDNAADLAFLVDAYRCGDWETAGRHMMRDRLVEPLRAKLVPCYGAVRQAAVQAGAYGCALSGSGPALFALTDTAAQATKVLDAMLDACRGAGLKADGLVTEANRDGVRGI